MTLQRKRQIKDEMIAHLAERLDAFWQDHNEVTTSNSWGDEVKFVVPSDEIAAARERILKSAKDRLYLVLLSERSLDPGRLAGFAESWLKEAHTFLEEQADAVAAEL